jgi:adenylate cyclase
MSTLQREAAAGPIRRATPRSHTFVFADLAGYTALTEAHGDEHAADAAADFCAAVRGLLDQHGAEEIKVIGDAMLLRVSEPDAAVRLAARVVSGYGARHRTLGVRVGVHTGTAVQRDGDWFGSAVNLASRVADLARSGDILLTAATRRCLASGVAVRELGPRTFKNVAEPVVVYALVPEHDSARLPVDPVCRMAVDPSRAAARRLFGDVEYLLCSPECASAFAADPGRYVESDRPG